MEKETNQRFGSSKPVSEQELMQARACLRLLKQQIKTEPPTYFREEEPVVNDRHASKHNLNPSNARTAMKRPTYNAKESSKGFSAYDFEAVQDDGPTSSDTIACPDCGRSFVQESYQKHVKICKKVFVNKRKQFDSNGQKEGGEETAGKPKAAKKASAGGKWKQQSEVFRANLQAARLADAGDAEGAQKMSAKAQEQEQLGMTKCEHCGRTFNEDAAKRHIPICQKNARANQFKKAGKAGKGKK